MRPTDEQQENVDVFATGSDLVIEAGAGTGKSTQLVMIGQNTDRRGLCLYFNRAPAEEARRRFPSTITASTAHSLAFNAMRGREVMQRFDRSAPPVTAKYLAEEVFKLDKWLRVPNRKPISTWKIASLAVQTVRRFCYSDAEEVQPWHVPRVEGVVGEHERELRDQVLPLARRVWEDLQQPYGFARFEDDHYMKIWALGDPRLEYDFLCVDECFPAGTLVDTHIGKVPIERIASEPDRDWQVLSSVDGGKTLTWSNVNSAYKTPRRNQLVRIYHEHGSLTCTANHPVWVVRSDGDGGASGAWTPAGLVREGDSVPCLRRADGQGESDVFADMLANDRVARALVGLGSAEAGEDLAQDEGRAYRDTEPYARPGSARAGVEDAAQDRPQAAGAGRERDRAYRVRGSALYGADEDLRSASLEPRSCRRVWSTTAWPTDPLQDRRRVLEDDDRGRGGRLIPLISVATRSRSSQRRVPVLARVDRVALLESGRAGKGDDDRASDHVYTLSVEDGSYFADGVLVKNCQDTNGVLAGVVRKQDHLQRVLVGDSNQRLFSWRGTVDMMRELKDAEVRYLTQSFRFGAAVAEEANRWLEYLDAPLRLRGLPTINSRLDYVEQPDVVLCRTNADVIEQAMEAQDRGFDVAVVGGTDEVASFAAAADELRLTGKTRYPALQVFKSWRDVQDYVRDEEPGGNFSTSVKLIDRYGVPAVQRVAANCVAPRDADYVVSTVHKVKGMEWNKVLLDSGLAPDEAGGNEDLTRGECMVSYVATTRAREVLDATTLKPYHDRRRRERELRSAGSVSAGG
jgi:hypothetical protein